MSPSEQKNITLTKPVPQVFEFLSSNYMVIKRQGLKKIEFQLVLQVSSSHTFLAQGTSQLMIQLEDDLTAPLSIGQVIFESYLPRKKIYSTRPGLHDGTFFQDLQGNNSIFGKFCIWPFALLLCLEDHHRYRNLFIATLSVAKRKTEKKKKTAKAGSNCDDLLSFNSSPHSSYNSYILLIVSFVQLCCCFCITVL